MANLTWFLLRVMLLFSPLPLIAGLAAVVQGRPLLGGILFAMGIVLLMAGYSTRGQRKPPP